MEVAEFLCALESRVRGTPPEKVGGKALSKLRQTYNTCLDIHGLMTPTQRFLAREIFQVNKINRNPQAFLEFTLFCFQNSQIFEVKSILLFILEKEFTPQHLLNNCRDFLKIHKYVENWCHSDLYAKILSYLYEESPRKMYEVFRKWNHSEHLWTLRLSITSLIHYSSLRKKRVISPRYFWPMLLPHLTHEHHYIQKAIGWQLREFGNVYPSDLIHFLNENCTYLPSIVFSYATEKLNHLPDKTAWKRKRKEWRLKHSLCH